MRDSCKLQYKGNTLVQLLTFLVCLGGRRFGKLKADQERALDDMNDVSFRWFYFVAFPVGGLWFPSACVIENSDLIG